LDLINFEGRALALSGVPAVVVDDNPAPALARMLAAWDVPLVGGRGDLRPGERPERAGLSAPSVAEICLASGSAKPIN
jgi:hypothetical protein